MKLGLREANQHFSKLVRTVKRGEEVILTERGRPIAVVTPVAAGSDVDVTLERLARAGFIRLPVRPGKLGPAKPVAARGKATSQIVSEQRDER